MNFLDKITITENCIKLDEHDDGSAIMHIAEKNISDEMGNLVSKNGGDILEIGFGMHISADAIQRNKNISSHTIVEIHRILYKKALEWAKNKKNTNIIYGDWVNVLPKINKKFDGILHDTYDDYNIDKFLDSCKHLCKKGTIVVFYYYDGKNQNIFNKFKCLLPDNEISDLPYGKTFDFKNWELYYTFFNGENFVKDL